MTAPANQVDNTTNTWVAIPPFPVPFPFPRPCPL